jgi:hypothetical protein
MYSSKVRSLDQIKEGLSKGGATVTQKRPETSATAKLQVGYTLRTNGVYTAVRRIQVQAKKMIGRDYLFV